MVEMSQWQPCHRGGPLSTLAFTASPHPAGFPGGQANRCRGGQIRSKTMKAKNSKQQNGPTPEGVQDLLRKASEAETEVKAARLKAKHAKAQFKKCRKAFRKAKRLAKQARKEAKAGAKAFKSGRPGAEPKPETSR
jgi:hypothetical protein